MIPYSRQNITDDDRQAVIEALGAEFLTQGPAISEFENALKKKFSVSQAIACSSGTSALHLALAGLGVSTQTIGVVPAITFAATANAFRYQGAEVQFCDVDSETGLISLDSLESLLRMIDFKPIECKGVITPVSFAGATAPLPEVRAMAQSYGLGVVEDGSHSPGSFHEFGNSRYESLSCEYSDAACLSFHPVKHICCGEGGAVFTNNKEISDKVRKLRSHGIERTCSDSDQTPWFYKQTELGWNYRMTDFQAVLGMSQLARLDAQLIARRKIAQAYDKAFSESPYIECFDTPSLSSGNSWHLYVIRFKEPGMRNHAYKFLKAKGVMTQIHYIPLYKHPYYQKLCGNLKMPGAEKFFESCLSIPMFPSLKDFEQQEVVYQLGNFCDRYS